MAEKTQAELEAEKKAAGGETGNNETTGKTPAELEQIAKDQRKRAEIAEGKLKEKEDAEKAAADAKAKADADAKKAEDQKNNLAHTADPVEVAKVANALAGMGDVEIAELQAVARAKNLSLSAAKLDPLFQAWHTKFKEDEKKERNKLPGSRGSDQGGEEDDAAIKPGMSRDEHKKKVEELIGAK